MDSYFIKLDATHSHLKMRLAEIRFDLRATVRQTKEALERRFGSSADTMSLELRDTAGNFIAAMSNDQETLAHYGPQEGYTLHVVDSNPYSLLAQFEDVS